MEGVPAWFCSAPLGSFNVRQTTSFRFCAHWTETCIHLQLVIYVPNSRKKIALFLCASISKLWRPPARQPPQHAQEQHRRPPSSDALTSDSRQRHIQQAAGFFPAFPKLGSFRQCLIYFRYAFSLGFNLLSCEPFDVLIGIG
jgi:hypothetical protein